jgi:hypothetical protein
MSLFDYHRVDRARPLNPGVRRPRDSNMAIDDEYRRLLGTLIGVRIRHVVYITSNTDAVEPTWDKGPVDVLDQGVEFVLSSNETIRFAWDWNYHQYGLEISDAASTVIWSDDVRRADVSREPRWSGVIGEPLTGATCYWCQSDDETSPSPLYPLDVELRFGAVQRRWLMAAKFLGSEGELVKAADGVVIAHQDAVARQYNCGPYLTQDWLALQTVV